MTRRKTLACPTENRCSRVLEDEAGIPTTDLFGDKELYAAKGESADSESSLD